MCKRVIWIERDRGFTLTNPPLVIAAYPVSHAEYRVCQLILAVQFDRCLACLHGLLDRFFRRPLNPAANQIPAVAETEHGVCHRILAGLFYESAANVLGLNGVLWGDTIKMPVGLH